MEDTTNLLVQAIANDDAEIVKNILNNQNPVFDVNQQIIEDQSTALHLAVSKNSCNVTKLLLQSGANANIRNRDGVTCFHLAVNKNYIDLVKLFLEENIGKKNCPNVNTVCLRGDTPLISAMIKKNVSLFQSLLSHGVDPNIKNAVYEGTALHMLLNIKDHFTDDLMFSFVKLLVEHGADMNFIDELEETPLCVAVQKDHRLEVIQYLLSNGADVNANSGAALFEAIRAKNLNLAKYLLERGADISAKHHRGGSNVIYYVILRKYGELGCDFVNLLLDYKADINDFDKYGTTPLILSIFLRQIEMFNLLIKRGASVFIRRGSRTALSYAAEYGLYDCTKTLISMGALDYERSFTNDAGILGFLYRDMEGILKLFVDNGVKVKDEDLFECIKWGGHLRFKCLFSSYSNTNPTSPIKHQLLKHAIVHERLNSVEYLLDLNADINYKHENSSSSVIALQSFLKDSTKTKGVAELVLKQMAFMSAQNLYVDEESVKLIESNQWISEYYMMYKQKIEDMKKIKVFGDHYTTYFDVSTKRNNALVKHLRCEMVRVELSSENYKQLFERYFSYRIEKNFKEGVKRLTMVDEFRKVLEDIFKDTLGNDIICMISECYNDEEFKACLG